VAFLKNALLGHFCLVFVGLVSLFVVVNGNNLSDHKITARSWEKAASIPFVGLSLSSAMLEIGERKTPHPELRAYQERN